VLDRFTGNTKEARRRKSAVKKQNETHAHVQVIRVPWFDKITRIAANEEARCGPIYSIRGEYMFTIETKVLMNSA
jgi:hypothetical protein